MKAGATGLMAPRPKRGAKRPETSPDDRIAVIHLKGTPAYADWLESIHRATHIPKAVLIRLAVAEWAKNHGHPEPPEM
jgi:hypothetical protein